MFIAWVKEVWIHVHQYLLKRHLGCFDEECVEVLSHENEIDISGMGHSINSQITRFYSITLSRSMSRLTLSILRMKICQVGAKDSFQ